MPDFVFDNTAVPEGKADRRPPTGPAEQRITAVEWNSLCQAVKDLRSAMLTGQFHGLTPTAAAVSGANMARLRVKDNRLQVSENAGAYRTALMPSLHVGDFGAVGDGTTNDAAAIATAIAAAVAQKRPLQFAALTYKVNTPVDLTGCDGVELIGAGLASANRTVILAGASMASVLAGTASYVRVKGIKFDANHLATHGLAIVGSSFSRFEDCYFFQALQDGINLGATGINDANVFENCWSTHNGQIFCTSGFNSLLGDHRLVAATGTVSCTIGSQSIVGVGTHFLSMGLRVDDFLRIGTAADGDQFLQIETIVDDTHLTVQERRVPTANLSGAGFAIGVGCGYREVRHNDNNITHITGGLWRLNAAAGLQFNGLYGPVVSHPQVDLCGFYGIVIGSAIGGAPIANTNVHGAYFEDCKAKPFFFGSAQGVTISNPVTGVDFADAYHMGAAFENFGVWHDKFGLNAIGNSASDVPSSFGAYPSFTLGGVLKHSVANPGTPVAGTTIPVTASHLALPVGGVTVMTATPTIANGTLGQQVTLYNQTGDTITLKDEAALPGSKLRLQTPTVVLALGDSITLVWTTAGKWFEAYRTVAATVNTGDVTLAAVGSAPSANGASLSGQALTLQPADDTHPGVVTAGTQTIGGAKTFLAAVSAPSFTSTEAVNNTVIAGPDGNNMGVGQSGYSGWTFNNGISITAAAPFSTRASSGTNGYNLLDGARMNFSTGDGSSYISRTAANTLATPAQFRAASVGVGNSASASVIPVSGLVKKIEIFDASGTSLGFIPVYSSIT